MWAGFLANALAGPEPRAKKSPTLTDHPAFCAPRVDIAGELVLIFTEGNAKLSERSPGIEIPTSASPPRHTFV